MTEQEEFYGPGKSIEVEALNIYKKLIEVRKSVPWLKKDQKGEGYKYVSSSQTLSSVREKLDEMGLLLIPDIVEYTIQDHETQKGAHWYFTILKMTFTWVNADNPKETIKCNWTGQGLDSGEKGVGKALTYGEKYFILKFFNVATDIDDPDKYQENGEKERKPPGDPTKNPKHLQEIQDLKSKIDEFEYYEILKTGFNVDKSNQLPVDKRTALIQLLWPVIDRNFRFVDVIEKMKSEQDLGPIKDVFVQHGYEGSIDPSKVLVKADQVSIYKALTAKEEII